MNFLKVLYGRQSINAASNEAVFEGHSMDLLLSRLKCHYKDQYPCISCHGDGHMHYQVPPFVSKFTTVQDQEHVLAVADEDGLISVVDTSEYANEFFVLRFRAHSNAIFDLCWVDNEKKLVSVSGDQSAVLWDVPKREKISVFEGHTRSIKSVHFRPRDTAVFATGGRDGAIMIWDTRSQKRGSYTQADNVIRNAHCVQNAMTNTSRSKMKLKQKNAVSLDGLRGVTTVLFQDENTLISAGAADGVVKVWDLRKSYSAYRNDPLPKYTMPYAGKSIKTNGYSNLLLDSSGTRLFASCTDDVIYQFNCASYEPEPVSAYFGHKNSSFFVKSVLCPREKYILSGSSDKNAFIWRIDRPGLPLCRLSGHSDEVTSVDWCKDPYDHLKLVTCCDDAMFRIWRPNFSKDDAVNFQGKCKPITQQFDQEICVQDPNYWMSRVKSFAKYVTNRCSEYSSAVVQSSSKAFRVTNQACLKRLYCTDLCTPKTTKDMPVCNVERLLRLKRAKLDAENCTVSPLTFELESAHKWETGKRPLTGKCLFIAGDAHPDPDSEIQKSKKQRTSPQNTTEASPARSPLKVISGNETSPNRSMIADSSSSPTFNLPNSATDQHNNENCKSQPKKRASEEHWLSKLSSLKRQKKSKDDLKGPEQNHKKVKTPLATNPIMKYFKLVPNSV